MKKRCLAYCIGFFLTIFLCTLAGTEAIADATTGTLNIILDPSPVPGLPNPTLILSGSGSSQQKIVTWGTTWNLTQLPIGTYVISGNTVTLNGKVYGTIPITTVVKNGTYSKTVRYTLTNTKTSPVTITLINAPTAQVPLTLTGTTNTFNQTVATGQVLNLPNDTYTVSSSIPNYNATATPNPLVVPTNSNLSIAYSTATAVGSRTIHFVNQCSFPVWFGFISGATTNKNGASCNSDADCYSGSTCVNRGAGGNQCFWKNPAPADNNFQLAANGGTNSVVIPYVQTPMNAVFSGAAAGRTNCTAAGCETGDCAGGTGACPPGKGFKQPATQAEFTFNTNTSDFYDIETVNGINIPVSMAAVNMPQNPNDPYSCGTPGGTTSNSQMGACSWSFSPPLVEYNWVRAGGNACNSANDCQAGTICGLSINPGKTPLLQKTCGKLLGYWNANQICGTQKDYGAPFNCQQALPAPQQNYNMINLLGCAPIPSCYQNGATNTCCGCQNWDQLGIGVPPAPYTKQCNSSNPTWTAQVLPGLQWIKKACPSVYTYPFDDMSSTFVCKNMQNNNGVQVNSVDYTITFCPGGKTGGL